MTYGSIEETGVKAGGLVRCVSCEDGLNGVRYVPGNTYQVVEFNGRPEIHGQSHGKLCGAGAEKCWIPFNGYGAQWQAV